MSRVMCKLYKGQTAAVVNLRGEHKAYLIPSCLRVKVDHTLNILYGVAIPIAISKSAVDKGCRS